jgi:hypothetical protein
VHLAGIFHNLYLKIYETEARHYRQDNGWKLHIHRPAELPTLGVQTHGMSLYPGQGRDLRIELKQVGNSNYDIYVVFFNTDSYVKWGRERYMHFLHFGTTFAVPFVRP